MENNNQIINQPKNFDAKVIFEGSNNILFFENDQIVISKSQFRFRGNNSIVYVRYTKNVISLSVLIFNDSCVYIGKDLHLNKTLAMVASESKNIFIGDGCLISTQVTMRTSDAHRLYDGNTLERLNLGKSVFIGDHVWLATRVNVLKGTRIHSGSVIGSDSLISNKEVLSNEVWGGVPARKLRDNIFYDEKGSHGIGKDDFEKSKRTIKAIKEQYTFVKQDNSIDFDELDYKISNSENRFGFLQSIQLTTDKNRFAK